jgi:hypothetical protein
MASEQQASVVGSGNIVIQNSGDYAHITVGVPYLTLIRAQTRIDQAQAGVKSYTRRRIPVTRSIAAVARRACRKACPTMIQTGEKETLSQVSRRNRRCPILGTHQTGTMRMPYATIRPGTSSIAFLTISFILRSRVRNYLCC